MTTCPAVPAGQRFSRWARRTRSSRISAHGRLVCASQPMKRTAAGLGGQHLIGRADHPGRLREAGDDRLPAGRRDPDQRVDRAGAPQRVGERHRQLRLPRAALGRGLGERCPHRASAPRCHRGTGPPLRSSPVSGRWLEEETARGGMIPHSLTGAGGGVPVRSATASTTSPVLPRRPGPEILRTRPLLSFRGPIPPVRSGPPATNAIHRGPPPGRLTEAPERRHGHRSARAPQSGTTEC